MFWLGIVIAFLAGVLSIAFAREKIKDRAPRLAELHLDIVSFALLVVGLALSAVDHVRDEAEKSTVRELHATLEVRFSGDWSEQPYPSQILSPVNHEFYVYFKRGQGSNASVIKLHATEPYQFATNSPSSAKFVARQGVRPGEFPIGQRREALSEFETVRIHIPFLQLSDFRPPKITVEDLNLVFILNGASGRPLRLESPIVAPIRTYSPSKSPWASFEIPVDVLDHLPK
jgi:hypothetical protein